MYRMAYFRTGSKVQYRGNDCTVAYVLLSSQGMFVKMLEVPEPVPDHHVHMAPTTFTLLRRP